MDALSAGGNGEADCQKSVNVQAPDPVLANHSYIYDRELLGIFNFLIQVGMMSYKILRYDIIGFLAFFTLVGPAAAMDRVGGAVESVVNASHSRLFMHPIGSYVGLLVIVGSRICGPVRSALAPIMAFLAFFLSCYEMTMQSAHKWLEGKEFFL